MIISVYEKEKMKRLQEKNIVIETIYYNPNNNKGDIFVRATDGKMNDVIKNKAIKEKKYFLNDVCLLVLKDFDSNFLYNIENYTDANELVTCPNCGHKEKIAELIDGCPYCRTIFNFGINDVNNSKKTLLYNFHFKYNFKIFLTVLIINTFLTFLFIKDLIFTFLFAFNFSFILSLIIICIMAIKKQKKNSNYGYEQYENIRWKISRDEKKFYNNFKAELMIKLYEQKDLIDFEIIDYLDVEFLSEDEIVIKCKVREVYYNNKINTSENIYKIKVNYNDIKKKDDKVINCLGCGAPIYITQKKCDYCKRINDSNNEWIIETIEKI